MTIPIPLDRLSETLVHFGSAVLVTLREDTWPRVLTVDPYVDGDQVVVPSPNPSGLTHVAANPLVTLYWPSSEPHGYTLIVDGVATVAGKDLHIAPDHAVLHRPSAHSDGPAPPVPDDLLP